MRFVQRRHLAVQIERRSTQERNSVHGSIPRWGRTTSTCDLVGIETGVNNRQEGFNGWTSGWPRSPVARRSLVGQDLLQSRPVDLIVPAGLPLAHGSGQDPAANLRPTLHISVHLSASLRIGENRLKPFSQIRLECTNVRFTIQPPPTPPSATLLLRP